MEKNILIFNQPVLYFLVRSNRLKRLRLLVSNEAKLVVKAPLKMSEKVIEDFILEKGVWILRSFDHFAKKPKTIITAPKPLRLSLYRETARPLVLDRLLHFNRHYNFRWKTVRIKAARSRWGSCSRLGNLNFNFKIVLLPQKLSDYIIVHELCHLKELNHGKHFWTLVQETIPDYKIRKKMLNRVHVVYR